MCKISSSILIKINVKVDILCVRDYGAVVPCVPLNLNSFLLPWD